jgi:hypothetical protein
MNGVQDVVWQTGSMRFNSGDTVTFELSMVSGVYTVGMEFQGWAVDGG